MTILGLDKYYQNKPRINMFGDLGRQASSTVEVVPQFMQRKPMNTAHVYKKSSVESTSREKGDYRQPTPISKTPGGSKPIKKPA